MKALDRDLRERILRAVERGEEMTHVAVRFEVGYSTVKKLKYRQRDTGSTEPRTWRCGRKRVLSPDQAEHLAKLARENQNRTLAYLRAEIGATCCLTVIWNELRRRSLSHKKSSSTRPNNPGRTSPPSAEAGTGVRGDAAREASRSIASSSSTRRGRRRT
jgi:transposase